MQQPPRNDPNQNPEYQGGYNPGYNPQPGPPPQYGPPPQPQYNPGPQYGPGPGQQFGPGPGQQFGPGPGPMQVNIGIGTGMGGSLNKDWLTTLLLSIFLGGLGIHRFYVGRTGSGIAQLLTGGGCGVWAIVDIIMIATGSFTDANGYPLIRNV